MFVIFKINKRMLFFFKKSFDINNGIYLVILNLLTVLETISFKASIARIVVIFDNDLRYSGLNDVHYMIVVPYQTIHILLTLFFHVFLN